MEAHIFRAAVDTKGHFTVDTTPVLPHMAISIGLMLDFGFHDWIAVEQDEGNDDQAYTDTMLNTYIDSRLMFNWGLADFLVLGFQIPLVIPAGTVYNLDDESYPFDRSPEGWSSKGGIGDIILHTKFRWLRADRHPVGIGTLLQYQAPVGKNEWLMGDGGGGAFSGKLLFDVEPTWWYRIALNVGAHVPFGYAEDNLLHNVCRRDAEAADNCARYTGDVAYAGQRVPRYNFGMPGEAAIDSDILLFKYGPTMTFGLGQSFVLWRDVLDFILEVYGTQLMSQFGNMPYFSMEFDAGFKLYIEKNSYLMAGYAHGLPVSGTSSKYGFQAMEHRAFIGFAFEPSIGDRDHDGIKDDIDQCPDDPEDRDDFEDSDGCPEPDNDRDGLLDIEDDCPLIPEDVDGDQDEDGCPEHGADDRDGDGIIDELDSCPDDPEDFDQFEDTDGCPDPDNDKDGILDKDDMCPNDPEDMDGWEDRDGCPDPDNDNDRILDGDDQCPNEPETYNGKDDEDGCPDKGDVILTDTDIMILKKVYFEYDSAVIKPISYNILDAVAATIQNNPQIELIEVQGHADERGNDNYNLKLTDERAASVVRYLTQKNVDPKKLQSVGYGEYCPVDEASNEAAWEKNRRVEFKVLQVDGRSTGVKPACERAQEKGIGTKKKKKKKKK
jgi:outer membrane protein OmpA-like peptidoglycan-associated protein